MPLVDSLTQDVRFALRVLVRDRGFALTAILVLGLGIGVNNMLCTIIYAHTLRGLPVTRADRILYVSAFDDRVNDRALSYPDLLDVQAARSFSGMGAFFNAPVTLGDEGRAPDRFEGAYVTAGAFELLGIAAVMGRTIAPEDDRIGAAPVAMLGHNAWRLRYGADANILGRSVFINGSPATVIGIMPSASGFPSTAEVWLPLSRIPGLAVDKRDSRMLRVIGRVRDDVQVSDARAEIESIIDRVAREDPRTSKGLRAELTPINQRFLGRPTDPAWLAFITAGFLVLVVSCANVANLLLARSVLRAREIAIRGSLGAPRLRVVRQLLIEGLVIAAFGGAVGLAISLAGVQIFRTAVPDNVLPYWIHYAMDTRVFAALVFVSFGAVLLFGLVPALQASKIDVNRVLKDGGRTGTASGRTRRLTTAFLAAEFGLTVILLSQVVTTLRSKVDDLPSDGMIDTAGLLTATMTLPGEKYRTAEQRTGFYRRFGERLTGFTQVTGHTVASVLPRRGASEQRLQVEGRTLTGGDAAPSVWAVSAGPGYFATLGVPLEHGREFTEQDGQPGYEHAIVNQRFVDLFFPQQDPVGHRIHVSAPTAPEAAPVWHTIIGVSQDIRQRPQPDVEPIVYLPLYAAPPATVALIVRTSDAGAATLVREQLLGLDGQVPLYRTMPMTRAIAEADWNRRLSSKLIVTLAIITLAFSLVGLYAVTAHAVSQRSQEIGVRMALGAAPGHVRRLVLKGAAMQVTFGLVAGVAGTMVWDAMFFSGRVDLRFAGPANLIPVCALLALVTLMASFVPARRAMRLNPVAALRQE